MSFENANEDLKKKSSLVSWTYKEGDEVPGMPDPEMRKIAESRICFRRIVNEHVRKHDAFYPPFKLFRYGVQTIYSKKAESMIVHKIGLF